MDNMRDNMETIKMDADLEELAKAKQGREKEILELIKNGKLQKEISEIIRISISTINRCIREIDSKELEQAKEEGKQKREESKNKAKQETINEILKLVKDGESQTKISPIIRIPYTTINEWTRKIDSKELEQAKKEGKQRREKAKEEAKQRREKEILELIKNGKLQREIALIIGISKSTINRCIREIDSNRLEQARKEAKQKRAKEILEFIRDGKTQTEIAKIKGVSPQTIMNWMSEINSKELKQAKKEGKQIKSTLNYRQLKQKLKEHSITKDEIDGYRMYLDNKYNEVQLKEVILMSNMYIKTKRIAEAIAFLNILNGNEDMEYLGKENLIKAINETKRMEKIQRIRNLLKTNKNTGEIAEITGLSEIEIIRIRNQIQGDREL